MMVGYIVLAAFVAAWIAFAIYARRKLWSYTVAIGGGFIVSCFGAAAIAFVLIPTEERGPQPLSAQALPACDSKFANELLAQIVNQRPRMIERGIKYVSVSSPYEQGFNDELGLRVCMGTIITTESQVPARYDIQWRDRIKGTYEIKLRQPN